MFRLGVICHKNLNIERRQTCILLGPAYSPHGTHYNNHNRKFNQLKQRVTSGLQ